MMDTTDPPYRRIGLTNELSRRTEKRDEPDHYAREKLTLIDAAQMAQLSIEEFQRMIAGCALSRYDADDFENDLATLRASTVRS